MEGTILARSGFRSASTTQLSSPQPTGLTWVMSASVVGKVYRSPPTYLLGFQGIGPKISNNSLAIWPFSSTRRHLTHSMVLWGSLWLSFPWPSQHALLLWISFNIGYNLVSLVLGDRDGSFESINTIPFCNKHQAQIKWTVLILFV